MSGIIFDLLMMSIGVGFVWLSIYLAGKISKYSSGNWPTVTGDKILVGEDGFEFVKKTADAGEKIWFDDIVRLEVYKEDQMAVDLICCDIFLGAGDNARYWTAHEDLDGFNALMKSFERLPGFNTMWYPAVVKPAFQENRTVIFDRASGKDFRPVW